MKRVMALVLGAVLLGGCAGTVPENIATSPPGAPTLAAVRADPARFQGARVRWGGTIAKVENRESETWIEIVGKELSGSGRPREGDQTPGRFIAVVPGFLEPEIYSRGREITVAGVVSGLTTRPIGEYPYEFPIVKTESHRLWEPLPEWNDCTHCAPYWRHGPYYYPPYHPHLFW